MDRRLLAVMVAVLAFAMIAAFAGNSEGLPARGESLQAEGAYIPVTGDRAGLSGSDDVEVKEGAVVISNGETEGEESEGEQSEGEQGGKEGSEEGGKEKGEGASEDEKGGDEGESGEESGGESKSLEEKK